MSKNYIRNHFDDIKKYAGVVENRLDDEYCTLKNVLQENAQVLDSALKYKVNYVLIEDAYNIEIDL